MKQLITAGLVVVKNRKLLLAFSKHKKAWYLPGGKADAEEMTIGALIREIKEELNISMSSHTLKFYRHISAPAFGEHAEVIMEQDCFFYDLAEVPHPNSEIESLRYFDSDSYLHETPVPGVILLMHTLKEDRLID